jgi:cytochrome P450
VESSDRRYVFSDADASSQIHPPLSVEPLRESPREGAQIGGYHIPGGVQVRVPSNVIQRDPRNFEAADEFKPDRWLKKGDGTDQEDLFNKAAFFPLCVFSARLLLDDDMLN